MATQSEQNIKAAEAKKAAASSKKSSAAKQAAASRAISAGQRLGKHKRGRAGSKLVSLGRKAQAKATQVKGLVDTVLGFIGMDATLAVQSEINWEASLNGLAAAADIAANVLALADKIQTVDQKLAQQGYDIATQAQGIIDSYGGDSLFDFFDNSIPGAVAGVQSASSSWTAQAQSALAGAAANPPPPVPMDAAAFPPAMDAGAAGGGGGDFGGGGGGGGGSGGGDEGDAQAAAEMAEEAGTGGGGDVDWGGENERDQVDEQRDTGDASGPDTGDGTFAEIPEDADNTEKPLQPGDSVVSIDKPDAGEGIVQLVFPDAADVQWKDGSVTSEPLDKLQRADLTQKADVMGNIHIHGVDVLAGDAGTGGAPSAPMDYGPSIGPGAVYTDHATIAAVQKALTARGFMLGPADGIFGPQTEAVLFKFSGKHGPPDDATLSSLGVKPGGGSTGGGQGTVLQPVKDWLSRAFGAATSAPPPTAAKAPGTALVPVSQAPGFWVQPAWQGAPFKRWQAATAAGGTIAIVTGLALAVRR